MEASGSRLRIRGVAAPGQRCRHSLLRHPASNLAHRYFQKQLYIASSSGSGPAGTPSGDINDAILFRFTDGTPSATVSTSTGAGSAPASSWAGILATGPAGSAGVIPLDVRPASPTTSAASPSASSSVATPSTSRPSSGQEGVSASSSADSPSHPHALDTPASYSDFYRKANTALHRPQSLGPSPGAGDAVNGWSHIAPAAGLKHSGSSAPAVAAPSTTEPASMSGTANPSNGRPSAPFTSTSAGSATPMSDESSTADAAVPSGANAPPDSAAEVTEALARAQAALERAETSLDDIQRLSSSLDAAALESLRRASPPTRWSRLLALARGAAVMGGLMVAMLASHAFGLAVQWAGATAGAVAIAGWGLRRGALAPSGAVTAFLVGCGTLGSSLRFGATLVAFFLSSSKLTSYKEELKEGLEENAKKGGQRTWVQVLCNGLVPTVLAVVYGILAGCVDLPLGPPAASASAASAAAAIAAGPALEPWRAAALTGLMGGFLGYYACCCGDTWASELGPLSADTPRLITTMRPVRRGTNGGVTLLGLSASIMGGMFVGLVFYLAGLLSPTLWIFENQRAAAAGQWRLIPLGLMAGLFGSVLDSVLGATLQFSGYDRRTERIVSRPGPDVVHISGLRLLDNNAVNAVSATLTSALTAFVAMTTFGF